MPTINKEIIGITVASFLAMSVVIWFYINYNNMAFCMAFGTFTVFNVCVWIDWIQDNWIKKQNYIVHYRDGKKIHVRAYSSKEAVRIVERGTDISDTKDISAFDGSPIMKIEG